MHRFQTWRDALQIAPSQKALAGVMADYIAALPAEAWAALPADCVAVLRGPLDIQAAAVCLLRAELSFSGTPEESAVLQEVAHTFAVASVRMTGLHGKPKPVPTGD